MATTIKSVNNLGMKTVYTPSITIQPGEAVLTAAQNYSVSGWQTFAWELTSDNNSYVYSDLLITGGLSTLQVRNMGNTAFTGRIILHAFYYPVNNFAYLY